MVHGIIIPADNRASFIAATFETLGDYQRVVGGRIQAVDFPDLGVTIYVNEGGLIRDLPFNRRATFLWWSYIPGVRGEARLLADVVLVGLTNDKSESLDTAWKPASQRTPCEVARVCRCSVGR